MEIMILLTLLFAASTVFLSLYIRFLLTRYKEVSEDIYFIGVLVGSYQEGLKTVYESEMFYGEPILEKLVENTKDLNRELGSIIEQYDFEEPQVDTPEEQGEDP